MNDLIERLLTAARHPDIAAVERFGPDSRNLTIVYGSKAKAFLTVVVGAKTRPEPLPDDMPEYKFRALHALKLIGDLLDAAKPDGVQWRTVAIEGTHLSPCGLELRSADGATTVLQVTAGGAMVADANPADWADWQIPADLHA